MRHKPLEKCLTPRKERRHIVNQLAIYRSLVARRQITIAERSWMNTRERLLFQIKILKGQLGLS